MDMSHAGERSVAKTDAVVVEVTDLVAGYLPGVNILNSTNLIARQGRAHRHHRPERRRQVDAAQGDLRSGEGARR